MMELKPDQEKVKVLLVDTISLLCRSGLSFNQNITIQGVIGITVDKSEVFLVHINQELSPTDDDECIDTPSDCNSIKNKNISILPQQKPYENKLRIKLTNSRSEGCKEPSFYVNNQQTDETNTHNRPLTYQPSYDSPIVTVNNCNNENDNRSTVYSPDARIKKEPGFTSTPYQGGQTLEMNESQSNYYSQNSNMSDHSLHQPTFKQEYDSMNMSGALHSVRGVSSNRRASRRRGGRRGGAVGTRPIKIDGNGANSSWEAMVTTSFVCKVCGQSFVHKSNLLGHQIRIHGRQKNKRGRPPSSNNNHNNLANPQGGTNDNNYMENNVTFNEFPTQNNTMFDPSGFDGNYPNNNNSTNNAHYPINKPVSLGDDSDEDSSEQVNEREPMNVDRPSEQHFSYTPDFHHNGLTNQNYSAMPRW